MTVELNDKQAANLLAFVDIGAAAKSRDLRLQDRVQVDQAAMEIVALVTAAMPQNGQPPSSPEGNPEGEE